jgi:hypothetical protein
MKERYSNIPKHQSPQSPAKAPVSIDITDKVALRNLGLETLVSVIQANPTALAVVPALKELFDRVDGKAPQSIIQSGSVTNEVNMNFTIEFVKPKTITIEHDNTVS